MVAVVPDLSVMPQHQLQPVALLQQQGGAVGSRVASLAGGLLVHDELDLQVVLVEHGAHGAVRGAVGGEADVIHATNRSPELACDGECLRSVHGSMGYVLAMSKRPAWRMQICCGNNGNGTTRSGKHVERKHTALTGTAHVSHQQFECLKTHCSTRLFVVCSAHIGQDIPVDEILVPHYGFLQSISSQ